MLAQKHSRKASVFLILSAALVVLSMIPELIIMGIRLYTARLWPQTFNLNTGYDTVAAIFGTVAFILFAAAIIAFWCSGKKNQ